MPETVTPTVPQSTGLNVPIAVEGSPYQSKQDDPYSSHSIILSLLPKVGNGRALDVGAAHGYLAAALGERGFRVTGIEGDATLAREAGKYCDKIYHADLDQPLPSLNDTFDVILYGDVLEHLKDPLRVLGQLNQYLQPDGVVIISLPNIANLYIRLQLLLGRFDYTDRGILDRTHLHFYTRKTFLEFLQQARLEVVQLTATPIPLPLVVPRRWQGRLFAAVHACNAWFARHWPTMFGYQFVAVARRGRFA